MKLRVQPHCRSWGDVAAPSSGHVCRVEQAALRDGFLWTVACPFPSPHLQGTSPPCPPWRWSTQMRGTSERCLYSPRRANHFSQRQPGPSTMTTSRPASSTRTSDHVSSAMPAGTPACVHVANDGAEKPPGRPSSSCRLKTRCAPCSSSTMRPAFTLCQLVDPESGGTRRRTFVHAGQATTEVLRNALWMATNRSGPERNSTPRSLNTKNRIGDRVRRRCCRRRRLHWLGK